MASIIISLAIRCRISRQKLGIVATDAMTIFSSSSLVVGCASPTSSCTLLVWLLAAAAAAELGRDLADIDIDCAIASAVAKV